MRIEYELFDEFNESFVDKVMDMNSRLERIADRIKEIQPKKPGSLTLDLRNCGKDSCYGCPHLRWLQWSAKPKPGTSPKDKENYWVASAVKMPVQSISKKREFLVCRDELIDLVREALELEKRRRAMLASAGKFRKTVKLTQMPTPTPPGGKKKLRKVRKQKVDPKDPFTWI
ncbi:hypothetical protein GM160_01920 [Guyparkeria halophila]|uniref:Uncharacterized protein n=1 Tax=Guyparkeria halophila TaxID=47960 RepID=A0A6I6CTG4_9GAMM|nr:hypothetical protein [Guyparkeria halophila]QGT77746.1 hypothetical protein GM160_01920 [Guyparkeria halophila]